MTISRFDYIQYKHALEDVHAAYKSYKYDETKYLKLESGRLKISKDPALEKIGLLASIKQFVIHFFTLLFARMQHETWKISHLTAIPLALKQRVELINNIHLNLSLNASLNKQDCSILAADLYHSSLKTIEAWNSLFTSKNLLDWVINTEFNDENLKCAVSPVKRQEEKNSPLKQMISSTQTELDCELIEPPVLSPMEMISSLQTEDEKALNRYFELLDKYPEQLKRMGDLNDHTKGAYQIIYDKNEIRAIQKLIYSRLYTGVTSHEIAASCSRPGVVCEDKFWIWIRDAVISPQGIKQMHNRLICKNHLKGIGNVAVVPLIRLSSGQVKISLVLTYHHATNSWEFELPRGSAFSSETIEETAKRTFQDQTSFSIEYPKLLGSITSDSEVMPSVVPICWGEVLAEQMPILEERESATNRYLFSIGELEQGLSKGYLEIQQEGETKQFNLRDPFLAYALLLYCIKHSP